MQAAEAITLLIDCGDKELSLNSSRGTESPELSDHEQRLELALAVSQAMLNSMIPVARYRAFVEVDKVQKKPWKNSPDPVVHDEFTITATTMSGIISGMIGVSLIRTSVRIIVFEQRATGADMISGFQGESKTDEYARFLRGLKALETMPTVQ